jgi:hypothetical protein
MLLGIRSQSLDDEGYLVLVTRCPECEDTTPIRVLPSEMRQYQMGAKIQMAFENYHAEVREMIQSGIDPKCWDKIFGSEYDDEGMS